MCPCFDGAPVVASGDDDRVHAVHDAFIMGSGAVRIHSRKGVGSDNAITDFFARKIAKRQVL